MDSTEFSQYNWYNSKPAKEEPKKDLRKLSGYGVERELCTGCGAVDKTDVTQPDCAYYKRHSYDKTRATCQYLRFGFMCDKLVTDGKELN